MTDEIMRAVTEELAELRGEPVPPGPADIEPAA